MATEVSRSLKEINEEIVKLDKNLKQTTTQNKNLDKSLRLDPKNTTLLVEKTKTLQDAISIAKQKVDALKNAQVQMKIAVESGKATDAEYRKLAQEVAMAEIQVKSLNAQLIKTSNVKMDGLKSSLQTASTAAKWALTSIVALGIAFAKTGDEIDDASKRYRISAEEFQRGTYIFSRTTGNEKSYVTILETLTNQMASLQKGSAKAAAAFERVGLTAEDIKGKSPAQVIDILIRKLSQLEDVEERASVAAILLGSSGVELAQVAGLSANEFSELNEQLEKAGLMTDDEARKAGELSDRIEDFTLSLKKSVAAIGSSLMPMFEALLRMIQVLAPALQWLAKIFMSIPAPLQAIVGIILMVLIIMPKLVATITAVNTALLALGANPIAIKVLLIAAAVAALILLLIQLGKAVGVLDKSYDFDMNANVKTSNGVMGLGEYSQGRNQSINQTTTNYYDYSTNNTTIEKDVDINTVLAAQSTKIKLGGVR